MSDEKNNGAVGRLVRLINALADARKKSDNAAKRNAINKLHEFAEKIGDQDLSTIASTAITASSIDDMNKGLEIMRKVVDELSRLLEAFQVGVRVANSVAGSSASPTVVLNLDKAMESLLNTMRRSSYT